MRPLLVSLVLLASCASVRAPNLSGVEGMVAAGPTCPVERIDSPCPDQPVATKVSASLVGTQRQVAATNSDASGHFRLRLEPGRYTLTAAGRFGCTPVNVQVTKRDFVQATIECDTGIR